MELFIGIPPPPQNFVYIQPSLLKEKLKKIIFFLPNSRYTHQRHKIIIIIIKQNSKRLSSLTKREESEKLLKEHF